MKIWTIQSKEVIKTIMEKKEFHANISQSRFVECDPRLLDLYYFMLNSFNMHNNTKEDGLIFGFAQYKNNQICEIPNFPAFKKFLEEKYDYLYGLIQTLIQRNCEIVELEVKEQFNPIYIDINDFQFLMPEIQHGSNFTPQDHMKLLLNIEQGHFNASSEPSGVIQVHLPFIKKDQICDIYTLTPN